MTILIQMLTRWHSLLMLLAVTCGSVVAPGASSDINEIKDDVAHVGALRGKLRILIISTHNQTVSV